MAAAETIKNRYAESPRNEDWTIAQDWSSYSEEEHDRWGRLFARQAQLLPGRACAEFLEAKSRLRLGSGRIPDFECLSERLQDLTGWRVAPVCGLIPDDVFFEHLSNRRFPAGAFIRPEREFDYLEEPDIFHDIFGHAPLLANPAYACFLQAYGEAGRRAQSRGQLHNLARLYWYTIEFGLIAAPAGLRIFGAGLISSPGETLFCLDDTSSNRIRFNLRRVMRTRYRINDYQQTYFVIDSFENLLEDCGRDFGPLYEELRSAPDIEADEIAPGDEAITTGDLHYFRDKRISREASR
jgi:phenylalanine-4-hydroxylase